jgi:integrative and conjugative element protein (TIGR02256 family)
MRVELTDEIVERIRKLLWRAGRREIGGVLMAEQRAADVFRIADFSVDEASGEAAHLVRDVEHHKAALDDFFRRTGHQYERFNYLGEWHSHPGFPPIPSAQDRRSMRALVDGERGISFALLLIVKRGLFNPIQYNGMIFSEESVEVPVEIGVVRTRRLKFI